MQYTDFKPIDLARVDAAQLSAVAQLMDPSVPEIWLDLAELTFAVLRASPDAAPLTSEQVARCAVLVAYQVAANLGGQSIYVPAGVMVVSSQKKRAVVAAFEGHNHAALAREHRVTETRIRQILAEHAAAATAGKATR